MKIKKVGTRKLTKDEIALDKVVKSKVKNEKFGSVGLPPYATEIDKMKFSIARDIIIFKMKSEVSQSEHEKQKDYSQSKTQPSRDGKKLEIGNTMILKHRPHQATGNCGHAT